MNNWRPQQYRIEAQRKGVPENVINSAIAIGDKISSTGLNIPIIFNLEHLSYLSGVDYNQLYKLTKRVGERFYEKENYRIFTIKKKNSKSKRYICVPNHKLLRVQKYINKFILQQIKTHHASMAYNSGCQIVDVAKLHCNSRWLIKIDIKDFFEEISEVNVYSVFNECGYSNLLSFQLARLCTRIVPYQKEDVLNNIKSRWKSSKQYRNINYNHDVTGSLPQGAPTSPMLANLFFRALDEKIMTIANKYNLIYSRYSDDIALSSRDDLFGRSKCHQVVKDVYKVLYSSGLSPQKGKTKILSPGSRKIILGLVVNGSSPKLTKEFKKNLLQHLHFCNLKSIGPVRHAKYKKFDSIIGFRNHLHGLISYALNVDPNFGKKVKQQYDHIDWPPLPFV
ncbi:RNA-directed DNA polymerase [Photobacterium damselae subsp. damselae]|uniref:reverse transcriptase family protein n=1 Tax=Photobacterium damselae TaxID=38293 RepID=UPI0015F36A9D|nr:reverse transcriptase family protein [Photobacterium damselae]MBA5682244.1 RNA-directed DNA polymerase [Photobacterium damselae subsp. damselae]